ncbi:hypothetical protein OZX74_03380 [Bifidobacterium sp. ESL0798]|uniref:hypothetical protein n=1 Tax=Bifidobacterium sp. ESL0798 TaxID=2983235 RepID=UPI0023F82409|nr:hypothetical protein [Bifidobacterium sp. ESL0798]WEV74577.1 hypothetical protein OZX74_03380 [Bifidobacterium sp. ESL0798]
MIDEEVWRPLGVDSEEEIAKYNALHDGVPDWMSAAFWSWIEDSITVERTLYGIPAWILKLDETEEMYQTLHIPHTNLEMEISGSVGAQQQVDDAMSWLKRWPKPLQIADYILAKFSGIDYEDVRELDGILQRSGSLWQVSDKARAGRRGLVRRVPKGVQQVADTVMARSGNAGVELSKAWECLYGINPKPGEAYSHAIKSVEDVAIPVVSPNNLNATLGTVLTQMRDQNNWRLPMLREDSNSTSQETLLDMIGLLWRGQHDRHGGVESQPVTVEEATVAVGLATSLVQFFDAGLVQQVNQE